MAEEWLYLQHPKTLERAAVRPEHYADKHEAGFRLDPAIGGQEAPKVAKPSESDHKAADASKKSE